MDNIPINNVRIHSIGVNDLLFPDVLCAHNIPVCNVYMVKTHDKHPYIIVY